MIFKKTHSIVLFFFALAIAYSAGFVHKGYAATVGSEACESDFMDQIKQRAFLEAQRETIMTSVVIRKPDSVLEYSCFDQILKDTAEIAGPIFTESTRWQGASVSNPGGGNITINVYMGDTHMDGAINNVIMSSLNAYINSNFSHSFLGGSVTLDGTIASSVSGAGSSCSAMKEVFKLAKCNNFELDDQMMTFDELVGTDPRSLPSGCPGGTKITNAIIDESQNKDFTYVDFDEVETFIDFLDPSSCEDPVPTGLTVTQREYSVDADGNVTASPPDEFDDMICVNPGCYFDGSSSCQQ